MKKLLAFILIAFASSPVFAQVQFNPKIGMSFMSFSDAPAGANFSGKAGLSIGADFRFGQRLQFQPGIHYVMSKTAYETSSGTIVTDDVKYNTLKLKGLLNFNLIDGDAFKFRANFGPAYDFLLSAKLSDIGTDVKDNFNKGTFYLQGGLGVDIAFLTADLGYAQGLSKTFVASGGAPDAKTHGIYFSVGIVFGNGKK